MRWEVRIEIHVRRKSFFIKHKSRPNVTTGQYNVVWFFQVWQLLTDYLFLAINNLAELRLKRLQDTLSWNTRFCTDCDSLFLIVRFSARLQGHNKPIGLKAPFNLTLDFKIKGVFGRGPGNFTSYTKGGINDYFSNDKNQRI